MVVSASDSKGRHVPDRGILIFGLIGLALWLVMLWLMFGDVL
jgi:hypothetical protein